MKLAVSSQAHSEYAIKISLVSLFLNNVKVEKIKNDFQCTNIKLALWKHYSPSSVKSMVSSLKIGH